MSTLVSTSARVPETICRTRVKSFSDKTLAKLGAAVVVQLRNPDAASSELIKQVEDLAKEARDQDIPPEQVIVTFKQVWNDAVDSLRPQRHDQYERLRQGLVTQCIRAYYAE
jgi:hypothetical protein